MRRRKFGTLALAACMFPSACVVKTGGGRGEPLTPDEELEIRARDLTRDVREAALKGFLGAGGVYVFGGPPVGFVGVVPIVITTGTYAGFLLQQYDTEAERRARLRSDIALANAETEAAIRTVEKVIAEDERAVAAAPRAAAPGASARQVPPRLRAGTRARGSGDRADASRFRPGPAHPEHRQHRHRDSRRAEPAGGADGRRERGGAG